MLLDINTQVLTSKHGINYNSLDLITWLCFNVVHCLVRYRGTELQLHEQIFLLHSIPLCITFCYFFPELPPALPWMTYFFKVLLFIGWLSSSKGLLRRGSLYKEQGKCTISITRFHSLTLTQYRCLLMRNIWNSLIF